MSDSGSTTSPKDKFQCYLRNAMQKIESSVKSAKEIVMEYVQATERRDFQSARGYLKDNVSYVSPLNSFDRAEPYLKYNLHLYQIGQLVKFDIKKEFVDSNDVCILHEWNSQLVCVWYHVDIDGKISSIKVIFDPRPFAAGAKQK
ncbi:MAG: nuclear transport factor 2 family protein [Nitrososphaeraceae archaeon]